MSLDSIFLVANFESYFSIHIPDREAESLYTIGDATDYICRQLHITSSDVKLKERVFSELQNAWLEKGIIRQRIELRGLVSDFFDDQPETLASLKGSTALIIPDFPQKTTSLLHSLLPGIGQQSDAGFKSLSFDEFCDAVCAANYKTLLDPKNLRSSYEVYIAVVAITIEVADVTAYDIKPHKSFTNDLGID